MRRIIIPLMLAFAFVETSGAQQKKTDLEHAGLLGKVKTVKVEEAKLSNKSGKPIEGKQVQLETQNYGENGMLAKAVRIDAGMRGEYFLPRAAGSNLFEAPSVHRTSRQSSNTTLMETDSRKCRLPTRGSWTKP